jgi:hypothetical protein
MGFQALCSERFKDWCAKFEGIGVKCMACRFLSGVTYNLMSHSFNQAASLLVTQYNLGATPGATLSMRESCKLIKFAIPKNVHLHYKLQNHYRKIH